MGKHKCPGSGLSNTIGRFGMRKGSVVSDRRISRLHHWRANTQFVL